MENFCLRTIENNIMLDASNFHRIIVTTEFWIHDDDDVSNYDVYLESKGWIDLGERLA